MAIKPRLSFWQIWNMSFGFLGIQFGFALQNANVSRIFEQLGAEVEDIPILWLAAPVTGLIIQPIIGYMSDKTWNRLGRRRPYFLFGAIFATLALFIMPNSPYLWVAAGMLWILDASINISMEPFRAFVGDMLSDEQRTAGFSMQSFFIGTGAVVASVLPWIFTNVFNISNESDTGTIPASVKLSFYLGGAVFIIAVLWTIIRTKEYSPDELASFDEKSPNDVVSDPPEIRKSVNYFRNAALWLIVGLLFTYIVAHNGMEKELYVLGVGFTVFGLIQLLVGFLKKIGSESTGLVEVIEDLFHMPKTMGQLAVVQFFTWFALFSMWIYTTSAVTSHIYNTADPTSTAYGEGANFVGVLFGLYSGFAALVAFLLPVLARKTNRRVTHLIALCFGGLGLISFYFIKNPYLLIISMAGVGFAWASILSMPYAILTGALPSKKMGVYMGIFNFFIVIPQILAASILGYLVKHFFEGQTILALLLGGVSMILAGFLTLLVDDKKG